MKSLFFIITVIISNLSFAGSISVKAPQMTKVADLNNDGLKDLVIASLGSEEFHVYLQKSKREFVLTQTINLKELSPNAFSMTFELGDFNADNIIDMMIFDDVKNSYLYLGDATGKFLNGKTLQLGPPFMQLGKLFGKDKLVIIPTIIFKGHIGVDILTPKNDGFSSKKTLIDLTQILKENKLYAHEIELDEIVSGDFNGDSFRDIIVTSMAEDFFIFLKGDENGQFEFVQVERTAGGPMAPTAINVDADNKDEFMLGHMKHKESFYYAFNGQKLQFQYPIETGKSVKGFGVINKDGKNYLASLDYFSGRVKYFENWKKFYFKRQASEAKKMAKRGMWMNEADLDNDGKNDLVITDFKGYKVRFIYGK